MATAAIKLSPVDMDKRAKLDIRSGSTVKVWQKIQEKGKTRLQLFEGTVISRKHGTEAGATFTVRRVASGVGVEKIFPLYAPMIDKIEVVKHSKTRRSKLYYIRDKAAREVRKRMRRFGGMVRAAQEEIKEEAAPAEIEEEVAETQEMESQTATEEKSE